MSHFDGETGHLFEERVIGKCSVSWDGYVSYREALSLARENQPPLRTPTVAKIARTLREELGDSARVCTAVGTPLDIFHGVDGFVEFKGVVVTFDLTKNPHKDSGKADIIISPDDLSDISDLAGRLYREVNSRLSGRV